MVKWIAVLLLCADPPFGLTTGGQTPPPAGQSRPAPAPTPPAPPPAACPPVPDRSCATDSDCAIVRRTVSCCGTQVITGVNRADLARLAAADRQCDSGRRCGCASGPTRLDDGTIFKRGTEVTASCRESRCTTSAAASRPRLTSTTVQALERCSVEECGPAPMYPNWRCPDGVSQGGRGPCVRIDGRCGWAHLECP